MESLERKEVGLEEVIKLQEERKLFKTYFKNGTRGLMRVKFTDEALQYLIVDNRIQKVGNLIKTQPLPESVLERLIEKSSLDKDDYLSNICLLYYQSIPTKLISKYKDFFLTVPNYILKYQTLEDIELLKEVENELTSPAILSFGNRKLVGENLEKYFKERGDFKVKNGYLTGLLGGRLINQSCYIYPKLSLVRRLLNRGSSTVWKVRIKVDKLLAEGYDSSISARLEDLELVKEIRLWRRKA